MVLVSWVELGFILRISAGVGGFIEIVLGLLRGVFAFVRYGSNIFRPAGSSSETKERRDIFLQLSKVCYISLLTLQMQTILSSYSAVPPEVFPSYFLFLLQL
jgi:hypothetical protein